MGLLSTLWTGRAEAQRGRGGSMREVGMSSLVTRFPSFREGATGSQRFVAIMDKRARMNWIGIEKKARAQPEAWRGPAASRATRTPAAPRTRAEGANWWGGKAVAGAPPRRAATARRAVVREAAMRAAPEKPRKAIGGYAAEAGGPKGASGRAAWWRSDSAP